MRFQAPCYRVIEPKWSHLPLSGEGATIHGARFTPKDKPALHLSLDANTAIKESQATSRREDVDGANSSAISIDGVHLVRKRLSVSGQYHVQGTLRYQRLSHQSRLMCH
jgi:RES domain-containing protein